MKKIFAVAMLLLASSMARAADASWNGFHAGVLGGYGWVQSSDVSAKGGLFGVRVGFDQRWGDVLFGLAGDWSWGSLKDARTTGLVSAEASVTQFATLRGRLGWTPAEAMLVYVTGGGAWARAGLSASVVGLTSSDSTDRFGWSAGGGVEFAVSRQWLIGFEYLYADLGTANVAVFGVPASARLRPQVARASISYRF